MQYMQNLACRNCGHKKPTMNTMGQACWAYYPLAAERMKCEGERHCPECHGIIHRSHSECLACRQARRDADAAANAAAAPSSRAMLAAAPSLALPAPPDAAPKSGFQALCDKYAGMDPEAVLKDLEEQKAATGCGVVAKSPIEAVAELTRRQEEAAKRESEANARKLKQAKVQAEEMSSALDARRKQAADRIQAMLDADEAAPDQQPAASAPAPAPAAAPSSSSAAPRKRTAEEEEERKEKRARLRREQAEKEEQKRREQRERRQQRMQANGGGGGAQAVGAGAAAVLTGGGSSSVVVVGE